MELYNSKKFGELLGYGKCALNKYSVGNISIHFNIHKVGDNLVKYKQLFGLRCNIKSLDTKYYFDLFVKINTLLQKSKYYVSLRYYDMNRLL